MCRASTALIYQLKTGFTFSSHLAGHRTGERLTFKVFRFGIMLITTALIWVKCSEKLDS